MNEKILFLAHVDESGNALPKIAFEALGAATRSFATTQLAAGNRPHR